MTLLVGFTSGEPGDDALALGARLGAGLGERLLVVHVRPGSDLGRDQDDVPDQPVAHDQARVDADWAAEVRAASCAELREARRRVPDGIRRRMRSVEAPSAARGLADSAATTGAVGVVIGSAVGGGAGATGARSSEFGSDGLGSDGLGSDGLGPIGLGTTADQLLHVSPVPVVLAPRGTASSDWALRRVTVAYRATPGGRAALDHAMTLASRCRVPLRLLALVAATVAGDAVPPLASGRLGHREVLSVLKEGARATLHEARVRVCAAEPRVVDPHTRIGIGDEAEDALRDAGWSEGDMLVCGSGNLGREARVFLGETAERLINAARVPVMVVPRAGE